METTATNLRLRSCLVYNYRIWDAGPPVFPSCQGATNVFRPILLDVLGASADHVYSPSRGITMYTRLHRCDHAASHFLDSASSSLGREY